MIIVGEHFLSHFNCPYIFTVGAVCDLDDVRQGHVSVCPTPGILGLSGLAIYIQVRF